MKLIKKLLFVLVMLFAVAIIIPTKADTKKFQSSDGQTQWEITSETTEDINGLNHIEIYGKSTSTSAASCSSWGNQHVNILEMKTDGESSKLVTWGIQTGTTGLLLSSLTSIAKDYEAKHPGWIVLGGVNGDQYYFNYGDQRGVDGSWYTVNTPCYPLTIDNEARYPITPYNESAGYYKGVLNNGEADSLYEPTEIAGFRVEVIDENGDILYWHKIDAINEQATDSTTTVWSSFILGDSSNHYKEFDVTTDKDLYIVEIPELAYMTTSTEYNMGLRNSMFGRGTITKIDKTYSFGGMKTNRERGQYVNGFAIETSDAELVSKLQLGTRIRVEAYYNNALDDVECFLNYHSCQVLDGKSVHSDQAYDITRYNRSIWGKKADGTYVLVTGAKSNYAGLSQEETNTLLLEYGIVEAYQQDGGGSSMCITRNMKTGEFVLSQPSSDGNGLGQRSVAEAIFFVVRDPGVEVLSKNVNYYSATFTAKELATSAKYTNIKIEVNGKEYAFDGTSLTIEGLDPETEYTYTVKYDFTDIDSSGSGTFQGTFKTDKFPYPTGIVELKDAYKEKLVFSVNDEKVTNIVLYVNKEAHAYTDTENKQIVVEDLTRDEEYTCYYTYNIVNDKLGKTYEYTSAEFTAKTTDFEIPQITNFAIDRVGDDYVRFAYTYTDPDKVVTAAYILCGNEENDLEIKSGTIKITDLLLSEKEYKFQLILEYNGITVESEVLTAGSVPTEEPVKKGCGSSSAIICYLLAATAVIFFRRKH